MTPTSPPPPYTPTLSPPWDDPQYLVGVQLFRDELYFEAHEELEAAWKRHEPGPEKLFVQGLIQLAVSLEHWRRGNARGARGQWAKAREKLEPLPAEFGGLQLGALLDGFRAWYAPIDLDEAVRAQIEGRWVAPPAHMPRPAPRWIGEP